MKTPIRYWCPYCEEEHLETEKPNQAPILEGKCSANHRWPKDVGNWRVCHATFDVMGGPNTIGKAHLCDPCWMKLFAPAYAFQKAFVGDLDPATRQAIEGTVQDLDRAIRGRRQP